MEDSLWKDNLQVCALPVLLVVQQAMLNSPRFLRSGSESKRRKGGKEESFLRKEVGEMRIWGIDNFVFCFVSKESVSIQS